LPLFPTTQANPISQAVFWVETKGRTLEEVDALFEGSKHSTVPDVEAVRKGQERIDMGAFNKSGGGGGGGGGGYAADTKAGMMEGDGKNAEGGTTVQEI